MKCGWPMRDTLSFEAIAENSDYPNFKNSAKQDEEFLKWKARHEVSNKSVSFYFLITLIYVNFQIKAFLSRTNVQHINLLPYKQRYCNINEFRNKWCMKKLSSQFCSFLLMAPQLRTLSIDNIYMPEKSLIQIGKNCPLLEELTLRNCIKSNGAENGLKSIFIHCSKLKYLDIYRYSFIVGTFFEYIPPQLSYLNLGHTFSFPPVTLLTLYEKVKNLETLILEYCYLDDINNRLSKLTKLRFLSIRNARFHEDLVTSLDLSYLKELEVVNLHLGDAVTLRTLESLQNCPKLRALEVWDDCESVMDFNEFIPIFKKLKALKSLSLQDFGNLDGLVGFVKSSQLKVRFFKT